MNNVVGALQLSRMLPPKEGAGTGGANQHIAHRNVVDGHQVPLINYWGFSYGTILGNTLVPFSRNASDVLSSMVLGCC